MKKLSYQPIRCLMALALLLMPLGIMAQDEHEQHVDNPDLKFVDPDKQAAALIEVSEWKINWSGRENASYPQLYNPYQLQGIYYESSNEDVATIDANGHITPIAPGTTTITAIFDGDGIYDYGTASYNLTYEDDRYEFSQSGAQFGNPKTSATPITEVSATYGDTSVDLPELWKGNLNQAVFTYDSSDKSVATVDASSGAVTIVGVGQTDISASFAGNDSYLPGSVSYTLTVNPKTVTVTGGITASDKTYDGSTTVTLACGNATISGRVGNDVLTVTATGAFADPNVGTSKTVAISGITLGGAAVANYTLAASGNQSSATANITAKEATLSWSNTSFTYDGQTHVPTAAVSNLVGTDACSVTVDGAQTNAGTYTATATALGNANYKLPSAVTQSFTIGKAAGSISYSVVSIGKTFGEAAFTNPLTKTGDGTVTYSSSQTDVATVNSTTGEVTIVGNGITTITATVADGINYTYASKTASYTLDVGGATMTVSANGFDGPYDGQAHGISVTVTNPEGATVMYGVREGTYNQNVSPTYIEVGTYTVYYQVTKENYTTYNGSATVNITKATPVVAFLASTANAKMGETFSPPQLDTTPSGLSVTYSSSNEKVATVNSTSGVVTLVAAGVTTITATFAGNDHYEAASGSYVLTVEASGDPDNPDNPDNPDDPDNPDNPDDPDPQKLDPIVKNEAYTMDPEDFLNPDGSEKNLENTIINDILFTLKDTDSETGDGYDPDEQCVVINTVTPFSALEYLLGNGAQPGTAEYAKLFTGLTFLLPAGEGEIIIESQEANGYYLMMLVGTSIPIPIYQTVRNEFRLLYFSAEESFVYLWNGGTDGAAAARSQTIQKGKKAVGNVKVYTVTYKAKSSASGIECIGQEIDLLGEPWYDLNGRRVTQPQQKGIYLHGGRKVVIK